MTEYKIGSATVRVHGTPDRDKLKSASERFMKQVIAAKKKAAREAARPTSGEDSA